MEDVAYSVFMAIWFFGALVCTVLGALVAGWKGHDEPLFIGIMAGCLLPLSPLLGVLWLLVKLGELTRNLWDRSDDVG